MLSISRGKSALRLTAIAGIVSSVTPTWAQEAMCQISIGYAPLAIPPSTPSPVPGIGLLGLGLLTASVGVFAWRKSRTADRHGRQLFSATSLLVSAGLLLATGTGDLIQAVRAAGPYELTNPEGGLLSHSDIANATPAPLITITNTSGVPLRITSNGNASDTGSCTVGSELAPNGTCSTQASCPEPQPMTVTNAPTVDCDFSNELYSVQWDSSDGTSSRSYSVYGPSITTQPTIDPDSPAATIALTYAERPRLSLDPNTGEPENLEAATGYTATVTATAPEGYAFGSPPQSSTSWQFNGTTENQQLCYSSGGGGM